MANTKVTKAVLADDAVGLAQLDITNDPSDGQALTAVVDTNGYNLTWATVSGGVDGISSSADATAITIDSSENVTFSQKVGIGVSPTHNFNLSSAGAVEARFASTDNDCYLQIASDTDEGQDSVLQFLSGSSGRGSITYDHNPTAASQKMIFKTGDNAVSAMTITGSGRTGLHTTSPDAELHIEPVSSNASIVISDDGRSQYWRIQNNESADALVFNANDANERLRIDSSGNVAIGTTSAFGTTSNRTVLSVNGTSSATLNIGTGGTQRGYIFSDGNFTQISSVGSIPLKLGTNDNEKMHISAIGNVGINITVPDNVGTFGVKQRGSTATAFAMYGDNNVRYMFNIPNGYYGYQYVEKIYSNGGYNRHFQNVSNTSVGSIVVNASSTAFNTTSDYRLKDNPQPLTGSGEFIDALQPKTWEWNHSDAGIGVGFIAHEAAEVGHGLCVTGEKDATTLDNILNEETGEHSEQTVPLYQQLDYSSGELIANMVAELQSLRQRVAELESN